jgi:hypothetical protein
VLVVAVVEGSDGDSDADSRSEGTLTPASAGELTPARAGAHCGGVNPVCVDALTPACAGAHCGDVRSIIPACAGDLTPASAGAQRVSVEKSIPWVVMQQLVGTLHLATSGSASETFREDVHYMTLRKIVRESIPDKATLYVDDWLGGMSIAWCQALVRVLQELRDTESVRNLEHGTADEGKWVQRLKHAVLMMDDPYADIVRRWIMLDDGSAMAYMSESGEEALRRCFKGTVFVLQKKMRAAYDARWVRTTSMLRLVSKEFAATVSWYGTEEPNTRKLRDFRSGRQRTLGEFFDVGVDSFSGWNESAVIEAAKPVREFREYRGSFSETVTADDALATQFAILQMDPSGRMDAVVSEDVPVVMPGSMLDSSVGEAGWTTAMSSGNSELDARVAMDMVELRARLCMATVARSKRVCHQITPVKAVWDLNPYATLAEEFEAQESDSSEESVPELEESEVLDDDDQSGGSEYWEAMVDSDLSDATVRTNGGEDDGSDSDFH